MNINLTDVELGMLDRALDAVWWEQSPRSVRGQSEADRAKRVHRKLNRAFEHANTEIE